MKSTKFLLILLSLTVTFSACKKDEEPKPVVDDFPSGIFIQFGDSTWKETQFTSVQTGTAGNGQPFMRVNLHDSIQRFLLIQLDEIVLNKTYQVSDTAAGSATARVAFALDYKSADGYYTEAQGTGTLIIKESNGEKQIEISSKLANQFNTSSQQLKARVKWTQ